MDFTTLSVSELLLLLTLAGFGIWSLFKHLKEPGKRVTTILTYLGCLGLGVLVLDPRWGLVVGAAAFGAVPLALDAARRKFGISRRRKKVPAERAPEDT